MKRNTWEVSKLCITRYKIMKHSTCFPGSYDVLWGFLVAFETVLYIINNFVIIFHRFSIYETANLQESIIFYSCCFHCSQHFLTTNTYFPSNPYLLIITKYSQFQYYACIVNAICICCHWWKGECCLFNTKFRICVLTITRFQWPVWRQVLGWQANFLWSDHIFIKPFSLKRGLTRKQIYVTAKLI